MTTTSLEVQYYSSHTYTEVFSPSAFALTDYSLTSHTTLDRLSVCTFQSSAIFEVAKGPCFTGVGGAAPGIVAVRGDDPKSKIGGPVACYFVFCGGGIGGRAAVTVDTAPSAETTTVVVFVHGSPRTSN